MEKEGRKRSSTTDGKSHDHIKCVISEFEDVLVPSSFFKEKLYKYVCENSESYLTENFETDGVKKVIECLKKEKTENLPVIPEDGEKEEVVKAALEHVKYALSKSCCTQMDDLVTLIFKSALDNKKLTVELNEKAAECLEEWKGKGYKLVILTNRIKCLVSSILLSGVPGLNEDDLTVLSLGDSPSAVKESYVALADKCQHPSAHILFITRCQNEAVAASAAGLEVVYLDKGKCDKAQEANQSYSTVHDLQEVFKTDEIPCKKTASDKATECAK